MLHKTQHQLNSSLSFSLPSFLIFAGSHIQGPVCFPETGEWEGLTSSTPVWEGRAQRLTEQLCVPLHTHNSGHMTTRRWTRGREGGGGGGGGDEGVYGLLPTGEGRWCECVLCACMDAQICPCALFPEELPSVLKRSKRRPGPPMTRPSSVLEIDSVVFG